MPRSNASPVAVSIESSHAVGVLRRDGAAKYLGISLPALDRITADGSGPPKCRLAGKTFGFRIVDLDRWLASRVEAVDPKSREAA